MGFGKSEKNNAEAKSAVGDELAAVLPQGPWYRSAHLVKLNFIILSLVMFSSANGYDGSLMGGLLALKQWNDKFDNPSGVWLGFINAIYWLGSGVCAPVAAFTSNKFGRKIPVWVGYGFILLGAGLQTGAPNSAALVLARFFVGCASAFFSSGVPLLISEVAYPTHRGIASSLFNCGWYVGGLIAAFITFGVRNMESSWAWRIPSLLQILVPFIAFPGFLLAPQSPRWLISMDRNDEARQVLTKWHAGGDQDSQLVNYEVIEITTTLDAEKAATSAASYAEMFKTPGNRKRLFISISLAIFAQWVGNGVVSYYLPIILTSVGITSVTNQTLINAFLQVWNLIFSVWAAFSVDRYGRRFLFLASAVIMLTGYIVVTALSATFAKNHNPNVGIAVIPFLFIFFAGYDIALTPLVISYPCEIWPYRLRSRGLAVSQCTTVLAICFNTFVNPLALESIAWRYYIVFVVVLVVYFFTVYFVYPETRSRSLEQMASLFDGDSADVLHPSEVAERSASVTGKDGIIMEKSEIVHVDRV